MLHVESAAGAPEPRKKDAEAPEKGRVRFLADDVDVDVVDVDPKDADATFSRYDHLPSNRFGYYTTGLLDGCAISTPETRTFGFRSNQLEGHDGTTVWSTTAPSSAFGKAQRRSSESEGRVLGKRSGGAGKAKVGFAFAKEWCGRRGAPTVGGYDHLPSNRFGYYRPQLLRLRLHTGLLDGCAVSTPETRTFGFRSNQLEGHDGQAGMWSTTAPSSGFGKAQRRGEGEGRIPARWCGRSM